MLNLLIYYQKKLRNYKETRTVYLGHLVTIKFTVYGPTLISLFIAKMKRFMLQRKSLSSSGLALPLNIYIWIQVSGLKH